MLQKIITSCGYGAEGNSLVKGNAACDLQMTFMWLFRARLMRVIDLNQISSFSIVENTLERK